MSAKRRPDSDLNHENWNDEQEAEESGEFQKASAEELAKRTIKTAKRRHIKTTDPDAGAASSIGSSVFGSFGGFKKDNGNKGNGGSMAFSFLSSNNPTNGADANKKSSANDENPSVIMDDKNQFAYYGQLKGLNQSITEWIQKKVEENPFCILTPIFEDYAKHLKVIEASKKIDKIDNATATAPTTVKSANSNAITTTEPAKTFTFASLAFSSATNANKPPVEQEISKPLLGFGTQQSSESIKTIPSTVAPTFSFGNLTSTAASSSTGFSFGGPGAKPFTFGNVAKPIDSSKQSDKTTDETDENADDDQPPKYEFVPVVEDNFYSKRCKIFVKSDKEYADRGIGMLYLKRVEGSERVQLLVRADTSLGNILLNILLSDGIPTQRMGKNNVMIICLPTPDAPGPTSVLIRVKNEEEANELLAEIDKNKK